MTRLAGTVFAAIAVLLVAFQPDSVWAQQADGNVCVHAGLMGWNASFSTVQSEAKGMPRGVDQFGEPFLTGSNQGVRYNKYVIYEGMPSLRPYHHQPHREISRQNLGDVRKHHGEVLETMIEDAIRAYAAQFLKHLKPGTAAYAEAEKREIEKARKRGPGRYFLKKPVFFAPLFTDAVHQCNTGRYTAIAGEYALYAGEPSPRVRGDLCSDSPTLVFDAPPPGSRMAPQQLDQVKAFSKSQIIRGTPLSANRYSNYQRSRLTLEAQLLELISLMARQCKTLPAEINLVLQQQDVSLAAMQAGATRFAPIYSGTLHATGKGTFALATTEVSALGEKLFGRVDAKERKLAAQRAREQARDMQIGIGAAIVVGILGGMAAYAPCHNLDNPAMRTSSVMAGCQ